MNRFMVRVPPRLSEIHRLISIIETFGQWHGVPDAVVYGANMAIDELVANAVNHADLPNGSMLKVAVDFKEGCLLVTVDWPGRPFDPTGSDQPDFDVTLEDRSPGGMGLYLVRAFAHAMRYRREGDRNVLELERRYGADQSPLTEGAGAAQGA